MRNRMLTDYLLLQATRPRLTLTPAPPPTPHPILPGQTALSFAMTHTHTHTHISTEVKERQLLSKSETFKNDSLSNGMGTFSCWTGPRITNTHSRTVTSASSENVKVGTNTSEKRTASLRHVLLKEKKTHQNYIIILCRKIKTNLHHRCSLSQIIRLNNPEQLVSWLLLVCRV